ncbi:MAG: hypothetical protein ACN6O3_06240 [Comamonas sp.]
MSETLDEARKQFVAMATAGLKAKYGEVQGGAWAFLLFGGYGPRGLINDAELVAAASLDGNPQAVADRYTADAAADLATDLISLSMGKALEALGYELTAFGSLALGFFTTFIRPTKLGDGTLPPSLAPAPAPNPPPAPAPTASPAPKPAPAEPKEPKAKEQLKPPKETETPKESSPQKDAEQPKKETDKPPPKDIPLPKS